MTHQNQNPYDSVQYRWPTDIVYTAKSAQSETEIHPIFNYDYTSQV